jgi:hypothetical protein
MAWRVFIVDVSFVIVGTADAIRGLIDGSLWRTLAGLLLIAVVLLAVASGPSLGQVLLRWFGRQNRWRRRWVIGVIALLIVAEASHVVSAASRQEWGNCVFHGVRAAAAIGLVVVVVQPRRRVEPAV